MDNILEIDRLQHLYLTGVRPNGSDIGVGAYGRVFEVEYCGSVFAAKEVHSILVEGVTPEEFEATKKAFLSECIQSGALSHPNVVQFLGVYNPGVQSLLPVLVMERMQESLTSVVKKYPSIPISVKLSILADVSRGLWYLHSHNPPVVHRDLSPNNILLNSQFVAKISDLGVAKAIALDSTKTKTRAPGTVDFMGPEALLPSPKYGPPLDIFSYGGIILHVMNQDWPAPVHYIMTDLDSGRKVALSELERRQEHLDKMIGVPTDLRALVERCLDDNPDRRPQISNVSERMDRMKKSETGWSQAVIMNPPTWQVEQMAEKVGEFTAPPTANTQQLVDAPDIFNKAVNVKWEMVAPLPVGRSTCIAVLIHGSIYVGGGFEGRRVDDHLSCYRLDVYNLYTDRWDPSPITTPYQAFAMTALDDKLIIAGGLVNNDETTNKVLVLGAGQWKEYSELPTARSCATAVGCCSTLIVVGGKATVKGVWTVLPTVELLDSTNGCWYTCANLPAPHFQLKPAVLNNTLYMLGGHDVKDLSSPNVFYSSLETLSTHQLNWQYLSNTSWHCSFPVIVSNKFLLTVGGRHSSDAAIQSNEVHVLNPSTGLWELLTYIPVATSGPAIVAVTDSIYIMGGTVGSKQRLISANVWSGIFE